VLAQVSGECLGSPLLRAALATELVTFKFSAAKRRTIKNLGISISHNFKNMIVIVYYISGPGRSFLG